MSSRLQVRAPAGPATAPKATPTAALAAPNNPATVTPMGWMHTARFFTTAAQLHHLPAMNTPEIAFVGRSNAGKSTCINTLTQ